MVGCLSPAINSNSLFFRFKLSDRERYQLHPYIVNNNYYVGVQNKESRQALNGLWFLTKKKGCLKSKVERGLGKYDGSITGARL